jgi:hypothetical protein
MLALRRRQHVKGALQCQPGDFPFLSDEALHASFEALTHGKAEYGNPGKGCVGPYKITKLLIEFVGDI